jgi:hypothetical protein
MNDSGSDARTSAPQASSSAREAEQHDVLNANVVEASALANVAHGAAPTPREAIDASNRARLGKWAANHGIGR